MISKILLPPILSLLAVTTVTVTYINVGSPWGIMLFLAANLGVVFTVMLAQKAEGFISLKRALLIPVLSLSSACFALGPKYADADFLSPPLAFFMFVGLIVGSAFWVALIIPTAFLLYQRSPRSLALSAIAVFFTWLLTTGTFVAGESIIDRTTGMPYVGLSLGGATQNPLVRDVMRNSPADNAGLLPGDIITEIDGDPVLSFNDLPRRLAANSGQTMKLTVNRKGTALQIVVKPILKRERRHYF